MTEHDKDQPPVPARRRFLRDTAGLTVAGLGACTLAPGVAQAAAPAADADSAVDPAAALEAQTNRILRWAGPTPGKWVKPRNGIDHDVVIVGGGQSGLAIGYGLRRKGIERVEIIERSGPGEAGIWRSIARMKQLRTPKTMSGPEQGNVALGFRAWFETLNGPAAFDALDRIPRLVWADYLRWFETVTQARVRYKTRLLSIEPNGESLRLTIEEDGARRTATTRKLVLANGFAGAGGPNVPPVLRDLPSKVWAHSAQPIDFDALARKVVAVIGAGSSAFDVAATALEHGASEVHMFSRDPYINYVPAPPRPGAAAPVQDRGHATVTELYGDLPDDVRWRNFVSGERRVASVPLDSLQRAVAFPNFHLHLNSNWTAAAVDRSGRVAARVGGKTHRFDFVLAGTGYRIDLSAQPELASVHRSIALWRDRYRPSPGEESAAGALYPYLGPAFEFTPLDGSGADYLRNIHCFNLAASLSFGLPVGDIPSTVDHPRLVSAIEKDLFLADVDTEANRRYLQAPVAAPDTSAYEKALA